MAYDSVRHGMPLKRAAKIYKIPPKTLRRHVKGQVRRPWELKLGRFRTTLNDNIMNILAGDYCIEIQKIFLWVDPYRN